MVGNPEDLFSHNEAHIVLNLVLVGERNVTFLIILYFRISFERYTVEASIIK